MVYLLVSLSQRLSGVYHMLSVDEELSLHLSEYGTEDLVSLLSKPEHLKLRDLLIEALRSNSDTISGLP